ncbi:protein asteroid homolog 1-like [Myripristis murdjan]|uniref:protein asteroid homolog 1-like n=1 Tax=Myripristis murdjan TaxID=586833 RepID=UPI001176391A|nr:protein asteroid homolog 1-like [Myripristis murdjan]
MGVMSLTSFIEANSQIYRDIQFRDSRLMVDGRNLPFHLYCSAGLEQTYGGEYAAFVDLIERFIKALRGCGIQPYVVLDGGDDHTDKKLETKKKRAEALIQTAHQKSQGMPTQGNILPLMYNWLLRQTLVRLEVPVVLSFSEADREVAALASEWQCPVLSGDSDFYIFDLPAGLLPIHHFQWEVVEQEGYVPCRSYTASSFCSFYKIQRRVLPAFAVLAGNDYVKLRDMGVSLRLGTHEKNRPAYLEALLLWLKDFQEPQEALVAALRLMGEVSKQKEAEVLKSLSVGMEEYQLPPSALGRFFTDETVPPFPPEDQGLVPDWFRLPFTEGRLNKVILNVLRLRRARLPAMVEHSSLPSAHLTSRPIRQVMYGLLLGEEEVEEYDREGFLPAIFMVRSVCRGAAGQLSLDSLDKAELSQRVRVLMEVLEVVPSCFQGVEPHLRLLVAVTCYWTQNASPTPHLGLLQALLLGLSLFEAFPSQAASALQVENTDTTHRLDHRVAHAFNQWQSCVMFSMQLNQLLGVPLPEPQGTRLYEGKLFHQLVHRLRGGVNPERLLTSSSLKLYRTLVAAVQQAWHQGTTASAAAGRRRGDAPQHRRTTHTLEDLTANLEQLHLPDEDKEAATADQGGDWVLVTHHKAKERGHRPKNPQLGRKQERRGWN